MYSQKLPSGKYRFFESYIDPMTMTRKTTSVTMDRDTRQSRKTAQEALRVKIDRYTAISSDGKGISLQSLAEAYRDGISPTLRPQTVERNMREIYKAVELLGKKTRADKLTARYITRMFNEWDAAPVTKNELVKRFSAFMRWAYKMDYIPSDEFLTKLPHYADDVKGRRQYKYLEPDELRKVIDAAIPDYAVLIHFLALSGLRIGEAIALTPSDIDDVIHVTKSYSAVTKMIGPTKTDGSTRDVFIQDELREVLDKVPRDKQYLFTHLGKRIEYPAFNCYFRDLTLRTVNKELTTHALRHSHVSLLAAKGVPLDVISRRMGHKDSRVTTNIYMHVTKEMKNRDQMILNSVTLLA